MVGPHIHAVSIGKISSPVDIEEVAGLLATLEHSAGIEEGSIGLIPWIETSGRFPIPRYK